MIFKGNRRVGCRQDLVYFEVLYAMKYFRSIFHFPNVFATGSTNEKKGEGCENENNDITASETCVQLHSFGQENKNLREKFEMNVPWLAKRAGER